MAESPPSLSPIKGEGRIKAKMLKLFKAVKRYRASNFRFSIHTVLSNRISQIHFPNLGVVLNLVRCAVA